MHKSLQTLSFLLLVTPVLFAQVQVKYPTRYVVVQRNNANMGTIFVTGTLTQLSDRVEARLVTRPGEPGESAGTWSTIDNSVATGSFSGILSAKGGRYNLEVRAIRNGVVNGTPAVVDKVGVGEVFLVVGHSNAQGISNGVGAQSDLVSSINPNTDPVRHEQYVQSGNPDFLTESYSQLCTSCGLTPFHGTPWFWGQFGDKMVQKLQVPVLIYGAAFGGSNIYFTYMSATNQQFQHGFIKSAIRMPYINIENALNKLVPRTGLRAILTAHGINDEGSSTQEQFYNYHKQVMDATRAQAKFKNLAWMIATACYNNGIKQHIINAQEQLIQLPGSFRGANLNAIGNDGRGNPALPADSPNRDHLHFNDLGQSMAASFWGDAASNATFLSTSTPIMPEPTTDPNGSLPVTLAYFTAQTAGTTVLLNWATTEEINNSHFEVQYSANAREFHTAGTRAPEENTDGLARYDFLFTGPFLADRTYFRLKQVDLDGTISYSQIVVAGTKQGSAEVTQVFPNPSTGKFSVNVPASVTVSGVSVFDEKGSLLLQKGATDEVNLSHLPQGQYLFLIKTSDGSVTARKVGKL